MQSILIVETQYRQAPHCGCLFLSKEGFFLDYQLEIKQIVDYPRSRIYREFIRSLMEEIGTSVQTEAPISFITWRSAPMPTSAPPTAG